MNGSAADGGAVGGFATEDSAAGSSARWVDAVTAGGQLEQQQQTEQGVAGEPDM